MAKKLPRTAALALLRSIAQDARSMMTIWSWTKKMERWHLADPALDAEEWRRLSLFARAIEREALALRELADGMRILCTERVQGR